MRMNDIYLLYIFFILPLLSCYSKDYENLYNWLISNKAYISEKIFPEEQNIYNRYIVSKEDINKNEELIFIPNNLTLSTLNNIVADECKIGFKEYLSYASKEEKSSFDFDCLVYFLIKDINNNNSFFKYYYNYLPKISENDFPIYFNQDKLNILNNIELDHEINRQRYFYNKALKALEYTSNKLKNGLSFFNQSFIYVSTRNFERRNSFFEDVNTLVPYLDLLNHNNNYNTWFIYDEKRDGFSLYAIKNIKKNEEITTSYGKLNNIYLYSMYGFTIRNNIYKTNIKIEINGKKLVIFPNNKESQIIKVINNIKNYKIFNKYDKKKLYLEIKKALENRLKEYLNIKNIYNSDINIINICDDLIYTVKEYIILCQKYILSL